MFLSPLFHVFDFLNFSILVSTAVGAATVVFIDWCIKRHQRRKENFRNILSIQIALNQMLNLVLQLKADYDQSQVRKINIYKKNHRHRDPQKMWKDFRFIDLRRFNQTITPEFLDWNYSQFLSKKSSGDREILTFLLPAKFAYQHILAVLQNRNALLSIANEKLSRSKDVENTMYQNNNLINILGLKLFGELSGVTNEYVNLIGFGGCGFKVMSNSELKASLTDDALRTLQKGQPLYRLVYDTGADSWELLRYKNSEKLPKKIDIKKVQGLSEVLRGKAKEFVSSTEVKEKITLYESRTYSLGATILGAFNKVTKYIEDNYQGYDPLQPNVPDGLQPYWDGLNEEKKL